MTNDTYEFQFWVLEQSRDHMVAIFGEVAVAHSERFRKVSNRYAHEVALAYGYDLAAAAVATDEDVAAKVAEAERQRGEPPKDWRAIGAEERGES